MKLLYIINLRLPTEKAHGVQVMEMCKALAEAGADVELVVPRRTNTITEDPFVYYGMTSTFSVRYLRTLDFVRFGALGFYVQRLSFSISAALYARTKKRSLVVTRDEVTAWLLSSSVPTILEVHRLPERHDWLYGALVRGVRTIVSTNEWKRRMLRERHNVALQRMHVLRNGFDPSAFVNVEPRSLRGELGIPEQARVVVYAGHLYEWKGAHVFAAAAREVREDTYLVCIGGTKEDVERFASTFPHPQLKVLGHVSHADIPAYLASADILVLPNVATTRESKYETSPLKLFEYMASRKPIIASDLPSVREIVDERSAVLIPPGDSHALAEAIKKLLGDPARQKILAEEAYAAVQPYSWSERAAKLLKLVPKPMGHWKHLLIHIPTLADARILDLGSGKGKFLIEAAREGAHATGLEYSQRYIELTKEAAKKEGVEVTVQKGAGEQLPFPDASFDFVNVNEVIEHVDDPLQVLKEVRRVLTSTGAAYVSIPNRFGMKDQHFHLYFVNWLPRSLADRFIGLFGKHKDYTDQSAGRQRLADMHYATYHQALNLIREAGLSAEDIRLTTVGKRWPYALPLYVFLRAFWFDSFHLLVRPQEHATMPPS